MSDNDDYQFEDVDSSSAPVVENTDSRPPVSNGGGGGSYATELYSKQIKAKFRTFFVDLKESNNGKFLKISEKSNGRKSTIMMDAEDLPQMIEALQEVQGQL
ncbi:hypothetical protein JW758_02190 [Candidatus Peregrinibacteria bacterium]|nr:hypothetical protein [Candidatus Peregrinibacteria bacterium]